jgi:hypothetical protein
MDWTVGVRSPAGVANYTSFGRRTLGGNNQQEPSLVHEITSSHSFCKCLWNVDTLSKNVTTKMKIEDLRQSGKKSLYQMKYFVLKLEHY